MSDIDFQNGFICGMATRGLTGGQHFTTYGLMVKVSRGKAGVMPLCSIRSKSKIIGVMKVSNVVLCNPIVPIAPFPSHKLVGVGVVNGGGSFRMFNGYGNSMIVNVSTTRNV